MDRRPHRCAPALLLAALFACSNGGGGGDAGTTTTTQDLATYVDDLGVHINALEGEVATHRTSVQEASDIAAIQGTEGPHRVAALARLVDLDHDMDHMASCTDAQSTAPDNGPLRTARISAHQEIETHDAQMAASATTDEARSEESRHQGGMAQLITAMKSHYETLLAAANTYNCPTGHDAGHVGP